MGTVVGTSGNDAWSLKNSTFSGSIDGLAGLDSLNLANLTANQFTLKHNTDGSITLDALNTITSASGLKSQTVNDHIILKNVEIIVYNNNNSQIDLRTYFPLVTLLHYLWQGILAQHYKVWRLLMP